MDNFNILLTYLGVLIISVVLIVAFIILLKEKINSKNK